MRKFIVTAGGLGLAPLASGTVGTLPAVALYVLAAQSPYVDQIVLAMLVLFSALSIWLCPWAEQHWGKKDPGQFVIDEVAGYFMAVLFLGPGHIAAKAAAGFLLARVFDVIKPFPARQLERLPAGWGVLLDDLAASVYANVLLRFGLWWWLTKTGAGP